jgi:hypothetical protein
MAHYEAALLQCRNSRKRRLRSSSLITSSCLSEKTFSGSLCFTDKTRRFSDVDVERARLLHQYMLHQCRPDAERQRQSDVYKKHHPMVRGWGQGRTVCPGGINSTAQLTHDGVAPARRRLDGPALRPM